MGGRRDYEKYALWPASASRFCKLLCVDYTTTTWIINHCFTQSAAQWSTTILGSCLERNKRCWIEVSSKRHRTGTTYWRTQTKLTTIDSGMAGKNPTNSISDWYKRKGLNKVLKGLCRHGCLIHYVYNANYASLFAMELAKLLVSGNITGSFHTNMSPKHEIKRYKQQKWTLRKNCQANKF